VATRKKAGKAGAGTAGKKASGKTVKKAVKKTSGKATPKAGKRPAKKSAKKAARPAGRKAGARAATKGADMSANSLHPGDKAPDFELPDDAGRVVSLGDFRGRKVVLYFYPKDSTPGCTTEACDFRDNLARLGERGAVVLGLSADTVESHRRFKEKQGLNFPLLSDPERRALEAYGVWKEKSLYGRKFMGIERTTVLIDEQGKVEKVFPKVKVQGHVDEVLASL
jgi:peroxiredoxin Q/BCP